MLSSNLYVLLSPGSISSIILLILWAAIYFGARIALYDSHVISVYLDRKLEKMLEIKSFFD